MLQNITNLCVCDTKDTLLVFLRYNHQWCLSVKAWVKPWETQLQYKLVHEKNQMSVTGLLMRVFGVSCGGNKKGTEP